MLDAIDRPATSDDVTKNTELSELSIISKINLSMVSIDSEIVKMNFKKNIGLGSHTKCHIRLQYFTMAHSIVAFYCSEISRKLL